MQKHIPPKVPPPRELGVSYPQIPGPTGLYPLPYRSHLIGGFIVGGTNSTTVLVRAIGPSLSGQGIADPLLDPTLELHDFNGVEIALDDDWKNSQQAEIEATTIPPTDDREAAIVSDMTPPPTPPSCAANPTRLASV